MRISKSINEIFPYQQYTRTHSFHTTDRFAHKARQIVEQKLEALHGLSPWAREFLPEAETLRETIQALQTALGLTPSTITLPTSGPALEEWVMQARILHSVLDAEKQEHDRVREIERQKQETARREREMLESKGEELQYDLLMLFERETFDIDKRSEVRTLLGIRWLDATRREVANLPQAVPELEAWVIRADRLHSSIVEEIRTRQAEEARVRAERDAALAAERQRRDAENQKLREELMARLPGVVQGLQRIIRFKAIRTLTPAWLSEANDVLSDAVRLRSAGLLHESQSTLISQATACVKKWEQFWGFSGIPMKRQGWNPHRPIRHYRHR